MKLNLNKLLLSEHFYSIQGEGKTSGVPAYFLRLALCNLSCGFSPKFVSDFKKSQPGPRDAGNLIGDLHEQNFASWSCDTMPVWIRGNEVEFQELLDSWKEQDIYEEIRDGLIHIIWTGGEPTIPGHQECIVEFNRHWLEYDGYKSSFPNISNWLGYQEIETNGTIYIEDALFEIMDQINCSPKLSNSGMQKKFRIIPDAIRRIMSHSDYQMKFVISTEDDIFEMFDTYIKPFQIPLKNVVCMPGLDDQDNFHERTRWVMEMAKKYKFIGLTRLHVSAWDKTTGV